MHEKATEDSNESDVDNHPKPADHVPVNKASERTASSNLTTEKGPDGGNSTNGSVLYACNASTVKDE